MAYTTMYDNFESGVLLSKDHIVDAFISKALTQIFGDDGNYSTLDTATLTDFIIPAGSQVVLEERYAGAEEMVIKEIGYQKKTEAHSDLFKDTTAAHNGVLLRAVKYDVSGDKCYVQNPSSADADGNKGWAEVDSVAVVIGGVIVLAGNTATSTWTASLIGGVSTD